MCNEMGSMAKKKKNMKTPTRPNEFFECNQPIINRNISFDPQYALRICEM